MAYQHLNTPCLDKNQLIDEIKTFVLANSTFTDAGSFGEGTVSLRSPEGWHYNMKATNNELLVTILNRKPSNGESWDNLDINLIYYSSQYNYTNNHSNFIKVNLAGISNIVYPILNRYFFSDGKMFAFVMEVVSGVYLHFVMGKLNQFGSGDGGEFIGGTSTLSNGTCKLSEYGYNYQPDISHINHPIMAGLYSSSSQLITRTSHCFVRDEGDNFITTSSGLFFPQNVESYDRISETRHPFWGVPYSNSNGRVPIYPFMLSRINSNVQRDNYETLKHLIRPWLYTDFMNYINVETLVPAQEVNNDYVVFPLCTKVEGLQHYTCTRGYGVAYRK